MRRVAALCVAGLMLGASCSVPTDESAQIIEQERLDEALRRVTTTTSSTTLPPVVTRDFAYYLLDDPEDRPRQVRQVVAPVPVGASLLEIILPMAEEGFRDSIGAEDFINQVRAYAIEDLTVDDGIATVFLAADPDSLPRRTTLQDVAAQLVWTLTGEPGVDAILININGNPQELPTTDEDAGLTTEPVDTTSYDLYNPEREPPETTTSSSSTTTTTTTVPPAE